MSGENSESEQDEGEDDECAGPRLKRTTDDFYQREKILKRAEKMKEDFQRGLSIRFSFDNIRQNITAEKNKNTKDLFLKTFKNNLLDKLNPEQVLNLKI